MTTKTITTINVSTQKSETEAAYNATIYGINTVLAAEKQFAFGGATYTREEVLQTMQSRVDALVATRTARQALHNAVAAERAVEARAAPMRAGFKAYLVGRLGKNSPQLQAFGFAPAKKPQRSPLAVAAGAASAASTRKARGTLGKKQKASIKGTRMTVAASPATSTAPAPSPAPMPTASPVVATAPTPATAPAPASPASPAKLT
jgi:hypothetical protein